MILSLLYASLLGFSQHLKDSQIPEHSPVLSSKGTHPSRGKNSIKASKTSSSQCYLDAKDIPWCGTTLIKSVHFWENPRDRLSWDQCTFRNYTVFPTTILCKQSITLAWHSTQKKKRERNQKSRIWKSRSIVGLGSISDQSTRVVAHKAMRIKFSFPDRILSDNCLVKCCITNHVGKIFDGETDIKHIQYEKQRFLVRGRKYISLTAFMR